MTEISGKIYLFIGGFVGAASLIMNKFVYKDNSMTLFIFLGGAMLLYGFFKYLTTPKEKNIPFDKNKKGSQIKHNHVLKNIHEDNINGANTHHVRHNDHRHQTHNPEALGDMSTSNLQGKKLVQHTNKSVQDTSRPHTGHAIKNKPIRHNVPPGYQDQTNSQLHKCHKCGNKVKSYDNFCSNCGHRLR